MKPRSRCRIAARAGRRVLAAAGVLALAACASIPPDAGKNPDDPFEKMNRNVYAFNEKFDKFVTKPLAQGYNAVVPKPARGCIANIFGNVGEITSIINSALQAKRVDLLTGIGRFVVNSTVGLGGCFDVANQLGWERRKQDFGATMGSWGMEMGPYLVIPILGPSSVRDALSEIPDYFTDPITYVPNVAASYRLWGARFVVKRSNLLDATNLLETAALDPYAFLRDGYMQRRRAKDREGKPPPPPPKEEDPDAPEAGAPAEGAKSPSTAPKANDSPPVPGGDARVH